MIDLKINCSDKSEKKGFINFFNSLTGIKVIQIKTYRKSRSVNQNAYYWGIVIRYLTYECSGYTKDEIHQILAERFLSYEKSDTKTGEIRKFVKSTTELNTLEFEEYLDKIRLLAIDMYDCIIPLPNETI